MIEKILFLTVAIVASGCGEVDETDEAFSTDTNNTSVSQSHYNCTDTSVVQAPPAK